MKVVFFGSIGLAKRILEEIVLPCNVELVGVCCQQLTGTWREDESVFDFCKRKNLPIIDHEKILELKPDLGISVRYNRIIGRDVINSFRMGIVNTHGGILPEYRGSYCNINAIINNEYEFGATLHYIDSGVDTGDIVAIKRTEIAPYHTGFDLYKVSERFCYELIEENIAALLNGTNPRIPQSDYIAAGHACEEYRAKETIEMKYIPFDILGTPRAHRIIRAFDSAFHEPAYTVINGEKIYLRVLFNVSHNDYSAAGGR